MPVPALSAARTLCEMRDWQVSNLELQKLLYLAHMIYLGRTGEPLIDEEFQAWDYGPVSPTVYARARGFGRRPVGNVFHWVSSVSDGDKKALLQDIADLGSRVKPWQLVELTHDPKGAWAEVYQPGMHNIPIRNSRVRAEYERRFPEEAERYARQVGEPV